MDTFADEARGRIKEFSVQNLVRSGSSTASLKKPRGFCTGCSPSRPLARWHPAAGDMRACKRGNQEGWLIEAASQVCSHYP